MERLEKMRECSKKLYDLQMKTNEGRMDYNNRKLDEYHRRMVNISKLRNMITDLMEQNKELRLLCKEYEELLEI